MGLVQGHGSAGRGLQPHHQALDSGALKYQQARWLDAFVAIGAEGDADHALANVQIAVCQAQVDGASQRSAVEVKVLVDHGLEVQVEQFVFRYQYTRFIHQGAGEVQVVFCLHRRQPEAGGNPGTQGHGPLAHRSS
ncbi:hypothetical protein D3C75_1003150 [compost metagenome]